MVLPSFLLQAIFDENATGVDLLKVVAVLAALIFLMFALLEPILSMVVRGLLKDAVWKVVENEFNRRDKIKEMEIFSITTKEEYADYVIGYWPQGFLIGLQHLVGGILSVPAVFRMEGFLPQFRSSLACLGILVEMGWELQDLCRMIYFRLFKGEKGAKKYPNLVVMLLVFHHSLTCGLGIPAILNYRDLPELHRLIFDLQFVGGVMMILPEYTRVLDVKKRNELRQFVSISLFMFAITIWTRVFDWFYIIYILLTRFYADENWSFLIGGSIILSLFTLFNLFFCVNPLFVRLKKFAKKLVEYDLLPEDAPQEKRQSTIDDLNIAAADFASTTSRVQDVIMNLFEEHHIERRNTISTAELSRAAAMAAIAEAASTRRIGSHRQSMVAWRDMPSRVAARAKNKSD